MSAAAARPHKHRRLNPAEPPTLLTLPADVWEIVCALVADNPRWLYATWSLVCKQAQSGPAQFAALRLNSDGADVPAARWQEWQAITQLTITGTAAARVLRAVGGTHVQTLLLKGTITAQDLRETAHLQGLRALGHDVPDTADSDLEPTLVPSDDWLNLRNTVDSDALVEYLRRAPLHTLLLGRRHLNPKLCEALGSQTELRQLKAWACSAATFGWLAALTKLRYLDLTDCTRLTDAALVKLSAMSGLEELSLQGCIRVTMDGLAALFSRLRKLRFLDLGYLPCLTSLSFLAQMSGLRKLHVHNCNLDNAALETLRNFRQLRVLGLAGNSLTDEGLAHLSTLYKLTRLDLSFCRRINGLASLATFSELTSLSLEGCTSMTSLGPLPPKLQNLNLMFCEGLRDDSLAPLAHLAHLQQLDLSGCSLLTSAGLRHLAALRTLQKLNLFLCYRIQDFKALSELKSLTDLVLESCRTSDSQLAYLPPNLQRLDLSYNQALTDGAFNYLASLAGLQRLRIQGCPAITQKAVLDFKTQRPRLSVVIN